MTSLLRYWRTLRHLRLAQILGQVKVRLGKRLRNPARIKGEGWGLRESRGTLSAIDPVPAQDSTSIANGRFTFIGETAELGARPDWEGPGLPRLWQYNLHYFDWLWTLLPEENPDWDAARRLTLDWIERYSPGCGACGWEPYPTSLRLINWTLLFGLRHRERFESDEAFCQTVLSSIGCQLRCLEKTLETHIQANHLLENLGALICVSSVFEGADRERVLTFAVPRLEAELREQILPDGMHYERSPMYHLRVLWLMEVLSQVGEPGVRALSEKSVDRMRGALAKLRHPDGDIAQFNDAAIGVYSDGRELEGRAGSWSLPDAGYYGYRSNDGDYLIIDAGPIGPDHQPGHAHADLLSFELSIGGSRVVTDTGIGTYDPGDQRAFDRSTAAHAAVEVGGENSVEVWGSFRVGRRSVPRVLRWEELEEGCLLEAEHCGYHHRRSQAVHRRRFELSPGKLTLNDRVTLSRREAVVARLPFAPGVVARLEGNVVHCILGELQFQVSVDGHAEVSLESATSWPRFGEGKERTVLVARFRAEPPKAEWETVISWI